MPKRKHDIPSEYAEQQHELARLIGDRIRQRRRQFGFSQAQLRSKLELQGVYVTRARFSRIETGQFLPNAAEIIALSGALEASYRWLLEGQEAEG